MKSKLSIGVIFLILFNLIWIFPAASASLTDQEIVATAKLIQTLRAENESLKKQVDLLQSGLDQERKVVAQLNAEIQLLIASYDRRIQYSDQTLAQMEELFNKSTALTKEAEGALKKKDGELWFWRGLSLVAVGWGASR